MYQIGDRVRFLDREKHEKEPRYYPPTGTVGTVYQIDEDGDLWVRWPEGVLADGTDWSCVMQKRVEKAED